MASKTGIEWTDATWNPIVGCTPVSEGCANCYAARDAHRIAGNPKTSIYDGLTTKDGKWCGVARTIPARLQEPIRWRRPRMIFVCSMGDLFHEAVPPEFIAQVFDVMADERCERHTFQVLTKRPERIAPFFDWMGEHWSSDSAASITMEVEGYLPNLWFGITAENQPRLQERWSSLAGAPGALRFISAEPLLGPLDIRQGVDAYYDKYLRCSLDWVIAGGESGPNARPCHPDWLRRIRDDCQAARVPLFVKQMGGWPDKRQNLDDIPEDLRIREFPGA